MPHSLTIATTQLEHPEFCEETAPAPTDGSPTGTGDYLPTGRVSPFARFGGTPGPVQLTDNQPFPYTAWDGSGAFERALGVYRVGPPIKIERSSVAGGIYRTSNGNALVPWGTGATINIAAGAGGLEFRKLTGAPQTGGLIARVGTHDYASRQIVSASDLIGVTNPAGLAGDISLATLYSVLRTSTSATDAQRRMAVQMLIATTSFQLETAALPFALYGPVGSSDQILKFSKLGLQDYLVQAGIGGVVQRLLSLADIPILVDINTAFTVNNTPTGGTSLESGTTMSLVTPDTADVGEGYIAVLLGLVHARTDSTAAAESQVDAFIQENGVSVKESEGSDLLAGTVGQSAGNKAIFILHGRGVTPGTTYSYRLSATVGTGASLNATGIKMHSLIGAMFRTD